MRDSVATYAPYLQPFTSTQRSVWQVVGVDEAALFSGTYDLPAAVKVAGSMQRLGTRGWVVDYEPVNNYTAEHAERYGAFLGALAAALKPVGMELAFDIADWSILKPSFWSHYTSRGVARYTSMTPTYDASNLTENRVFVGQALAQLPPGTYAAGIGTVWEERGACKEAGGYEYLWNATTLPTFVDFLGTSGVHTIDVWRCDVDLQYDRLGKDKTAPYFLAALEAFLAK